MHSAAAHLDAISLQLFKMQSAEADVKSGDKAGRILNAMRESAAAVNVD